MRTGYRNAEISENQIRLQDIWFIRVNYGVDAIMRMLRDGQKPKLKLDMDNTTV